VAATRLSRPCAGGNPTPQHHHDRDPTHHSTKAPLSAKGGAAELMLTCQRHPPPRLTQSLRTKRSRVSEDFGQEDCFGRLAERNFRKIPPERVEPRVRGEQLETHFVNSAGVVTVPPLGPEVNEHA
jgi:hypothetical protein